MQLLNDFRRVWPQLALTDLLARGAAFAISIPITGLLLKLFLLRADDGVLTDTDIAVFLLHPLGFATGLIIAAVTLGFVFAETGALMVIAFGASEDRRVSWLDALRYVGGHAHEVLALSGRLLLRFMLISAPFLGVVGLIYLKLMSAHDINFYLTDRPPEFRTALTLAAAVMGLLALVLTRLLAGWLLGLPLVLFDGCKGHRALTKSADILAGRAWRVTAIITAWIAGHFTFAWLVTFAIGRLTGMLIPQFGGNLTWFAAGLGVALVLTGLAQLGLAFVATALPALLLVRMFKRLAGAGRFDPQVVDRGSLGDRAGLSVPGRWLLLACMIVIVALVVGGGAMARSLDALDQVTVIAHRGASGDAPENTMAAFRQAIAEKADWIELDVQEDAEGTIIVAHDSDFMKVSGNPIKSWETDAETRQTLDIGSYFDSRFADQRIPTLEEVLRLAKDRIGVVIELKYYGHDTALEAAVVEIVESTEMADDILLMSLKRGGLSKIAGLRPDWPRGLLNTVAVGDLTRLDVNFLALNAAAARTSTIRRAHKRGMQVFVWTIDDPVQMSVMMSRGVDGIITDHPSRVHEVIEWRDDLGPFGRLLIWAAGEAGLLRESDEASPKEDA